MLCLWVPRTCFGSYTQTLTHSLTLSTFLSHSQAIYFVSIRCLRKAIASANLKTNILSFSFTFFLSFVAVDRFDMFGNNIETQLYNMSDCICAITAQFRLFALYNAFFCSFMLVGVESMYASVSSCNHWK